MLSNSRVRTAVVARVAQQVRCSSLTILSCETKAERCEIKRRSAGDGLRGGVPNVSGRYWNVVGRFHISAKSGLLAVRAERSFLGSRQIKI